jgi:sarcosine oxidase delta subunit
VDVSDAKWSDYLFNRDNPKGVNFERWYHRYGCRRWFSVARHTVTHEILSVYEIGETKPELDVKPETEAVESPVRLAASSVSRKLR